MVHYDVFFWSSHDDLPLLATGLTFRHVALSCHPMEDLFLTDVSSKNLAPILEQIEQRRVTSSSQAPAGLPASLVTDWGPRQFRVPWKKHLAIMPVKKSALRHAT